MMKHLYACDHLPKGRVQCLYCGRPESIGKFHATEDDCNETPLSCKSLIATALSPFRSPSSPRHSTAGKESPHTPRQTERESDKPSYSHLPGVSFYSHLPELPENQILEIGFTPDRYELDVQSIAELPSNIYGMGYGQARCGQNYPFELPGPQMLSGAASVESFPAEGDFGNTLNSAVAQNCHELSGDSYPHMADEQISYYSDRNSARRHTDLTAPISIPSSASRSAFDPLSSSTYRSSIFDNESMDSIEFEQEIATANTSPISPDINENLSWNDRGFATQNDCSDRRYATYDYFPDIAEIQNFYSADECMQSPSQLFSSPSTLIENRSMAFGKPMILASYNISDLQNPELDPPQDMQMCS
jgi:hypothetical protein